MKYREAPPLTGVMFRNLTKKGPVDCDFHGWVRVAGVDYQVKAYGPERDRQGRRRWQLRLTPKIPDKAERDGWGAA